MDSRVFAGSHGLRQTIVRIRISPSPTFQENLAQASPKPPSATFSRRSLALHSLMSSTIVYGWLRESMARALIPCTDKKLKQERLLRTKMLVCIWCGITIKSTSSLYRCVCSTTTSGRHIYRCRLTAHPPKRAPSRFDQFLHLQYLTGQLQ